MTANEIRIGNLVDLGNRIAKVIEINHLACVVVDLEETQDTIEDYDRTKPIPLTEEWLNKSDLKKRGTRDIWDQGNFVIYYQRHNDAYSQLCQGKFYFGTIDVTKNFALTFYEIKHLHQLQNLYFALAGEELTFKS